MPSGAHQHAVARKRRVVEHDAEVDVEESPRARRDTGSSSIE
jgi:hypothetical protein